ncbi:MAG TPA: amidohydrolase [Candidatus Hydrogenedentes bacterium]|nr:amidohydrolase [Candidatus Hydrogenedentota bacterium]HOL77508.1 amidohydrolase [Candidatus Hydrogenedentota bacterium]HPO86613.1 amidohydrolase [Candidatus Hydrogenedentota bacterium]
MEMISERVFRYATSAAVELRHELHANPELRFQEKWTSNRIAAFLEEHSIPFDRGFAEGTGIVATLKGKSRKCVALRAELDALPIHEETGLPYASQHQGCMHACGHDGHMAALCGAAAVLGAVRESLPATVKFLFQPGEETAGGAELMIRDGALDGVDAIFALHGWPDLPLGKVGIKAGPFMAGAQDFSVRVLGKGAHGAMPHAGIDPIVIAAHIITGLQTIVSRRTSPLDAVVVTVAQIHAGTSTNVIPESLEFRGTMRAFQKNILENLRSSLDTLCKCTAEAHGGSASVTFGNPAYPPVINDPAMTEFLRETARIALGSESVIALDQPAMVSEDFAFYLQKVRGAFFYLGLNGEKGESAGCARLHSPYFDFPDAALEPAIRLFVGIAWRCFEKSGV